MLERRRKKKYQILTSLVVLVLLLTLLVAFFNHQVQYEAGFRKLSIERESLEQELAVLKRQNEELKELDSLVGTPEFIERIAREQYGYIQPNEFRFDD